VFKRPDRRSLVTAGFVSALMVLPVAAVAAVVTGQTGATPVRVAAPQQLASGNGPLIAAVGDIACAPANTQYKGGEGTLAGCREKAVADLLENQRLAAFLPLGDLQYEDGRMDEFTQVYDQFFGRYKAITRPTPGNHEYKTANARDYYDYFGASAGEANPFGPYAAGAYSYDVGAWHLVSLNSIQCTGGKPCDDTHPMMQWLAADLAAHPTRCTMAYWHHPLYSLGHHGAYTPMTPVWNYLLDHDVDLVLTSHDHGYQRFAPLGRAVTPDGVTMLPPTVVPEAQGMRNFIVGTGGANNYDIASEEERPDLAGRVEAKYANPAQALFGALFLRLDEAGYRWNFAQAATGAPPFVDSGVGTCH
jgi:hypothetical protein